MKNKVKVTILIAVLCLIAGIGIGFGRQAWKGQASGTQALAADEAEEKKEQIIRKKNTAQYQALDAKKVFETSNCGDLLKVAAYKIGRASLAEETVAEEKTYDEISTSALAQETLETLEQETLQLMSLPAGAVWGGRMKVYAGETPLIITEEEKEVLLRIVEAEATCEDVKGRMLVASVILNRVVSERFPDTITEVVFQNNGTTYQFSPIKDGRYWEVRISEETIEAVERVLAGEDVSKGALFFAARSMANKNSMRWFDSSLKYLFKHGVHEFFTYY